MDSRSIFSVLVVSLAFSIGGWAQIHAGKITYERKTNLYKKYKENNAKEWLQEEDKNKVDVFELYFNDSVSVFKPKESDVREKMSWATSKNQVYQDFSNGSSFIVKMIWGEEIYLQDSLAKRSWQITDSKRVISGYRCRKAICKINDSTRIYAWYCDEIIPSVGPETFHGLPGAILGLATEDGGVIYFAKQIEIIVPQKIQLSRPKIKQKIYTPAELKDKLTKDFGKYPWGKTMIRETFTW